MTFGRHKRNFVRITLQSAAAAFLKMISLSFVSLRRMFNLIFGCRLFLNALKYEY